MVKVKRSSMTTHKPKLSSTFVPKNPDLISELPDSVLLHILSLLDADKLMIQTSLLSRRWRYLWRSIPCLCFRPSHFSKTEFLDHTEFIDKYLWNRSESKIHKLHIDFNYDETRLTRTRVDSWLHFAIKCQVEDLQLDFYCSQVSGTSHDEAYTLPPSLYFCTTLTSLNLRGCNLILPDSFQLGSLRVLWLDDIELNPDCIEHFSSSCPSLEDIHVEHCNRKGELNIVITNEHVKSLEIVDYSECACFNVKISAPTLLTLGIYYVITPTVTVDVENLASLMRVHVRCCPTLLRHCEDGYLQRPAFSTNWFEKLLPDLRHVKHVHLCAECVQVLSLMKVMCSDILSLSATSLELETSFYKWELPGIGYLLQNCTDLEKLKIVNGRVVTEGISDGFIEEHDFRVQEYWTSLETDVPSIMQNIKTVEIELSGHESRHEEEFVRFLLKNSKILESMVITTTRKRYLSERVLAFPRSSPNAKLFITHT